MNAQAILTVSAAVVALTQLAKWGFVPDKWGPVSVILLSILGVGFWGWSTGDFSRASSFGYFAGAIAVMTSAAGVFGFTRAGSEAITKVSGPPKSDGFTGQDLRGIGVALLAGTIALNSIACGSGNVLRSFRVALAASGPLVDSLVASGAITRERADLAIQDLGDGVGVAITLENEFKAITKDDPNARAKKLAASLKAERAWRQIIARGNFVPKAGVLTSERLQRIADIAEGILASLVVFYSDSTGSGIHAAAASRASVTATDEKALETGLRAQVKQLEAALRP